MEDYPAELLDQAGLVFSDKNMSSFENAYEDFLLNVNSLCMRF